MTLVEFLIVILFAGLGYLFLDLQMFKNSSIEQHKHDGSESPRKD